MTKPLKSDEFHVPTNTTIDWKLLLGGAVFGVGWAIGCFCPGPALFNIAVGSEGAMLYWFPCYIGGAYPSSKCRDIFEQEQDELRYFEGLNEIARYVSN